METPSSAVAPLPILQAEADNILWSQLVTELSRHYEGALKVVLPTELNERTYGWFRAIEDYNFRSELRYSFDEMKPILAKPELLFLFVFKEELPEIVVLGHTNPNEPERVFRLDTFAINKRGKGIGHIVMDFLIKWARARQYVAIELDTEETDEKGIKLQRFYEKHKFVVTARDAKGDITMRCPLVETSPGVPACSAEASTSQPETPLANAQPVSNPPVVAPATDTSPASAPPANPQPSSSPQPPPSPAGTPAPAAPQASTPSSSESAPPPATALAATTILQAGTIPSQTPAIASSFQGAIPSATTAPSPATPAGTRPSRTPDEATR